MTPSRNARHELTTEQLEEHLWYAYDIDPNLMNSRIASGRTEDIAIAQWWALFAKDEKYPRQGWSGYVGHDVALNPESI